MDAVLLDAFRPFSIFKPKRRLQETPSASFPRFFLDERQDLFVEPVAHLEPVSR
jgi:hypothetical protein